jgi:hypothetical protein
MHTPAPIDTVAARLAQENDAGTLAAALVARLRADGRADAGALEAAIVALFPGATIDPNPPHPGKGT